LDQSKIIIKNVFGFKVAFDITRNNDEIELQIIKECRHRNDWLIWKEAIQTQLNSLTKREVFRQVVDTPKYVIPVGYK
jgi:hypothetical protein